MKWCREGEVAIRSRRAWTYTRPAAAPMPPSHNTHVHDASNVTPAPARALVARAGSPVAQRKLPCLGPLVADQVGERLLAVGRHRDPELNRR